MRHRPSFPLRTLVAVAALAVLGLIWVAPEPAPADDRELLQFDSAQPYLFILLDSSASMAHRIGTDASGNDEFVPGYGDDPESRIYAAKEALHEVFNRPEFQDIRFGFASFPNHDEGKVRRKHWLYYAETRPAALDNIGWPDPALQGPYEPVDTDGDGVNDDFVRAANADTAAISLGPHPWDSTDTVVSQIGSCADPLDLSTHEGFLRLNAFPKLGLDASGVQQTTAWVLGQDTVLYKLVFTRPSNRPGTTDPNNSVGQDDLHVKVDINTMDPSTCGELGSSNANLRLFLDEILNEYLIVDQADADATPGLVTAGTDPWTDTEENWFCGSEDPFTGLGTEGNYDSESEGSSGSGPLASADVTDDDAFCLNGNDPESCPSDKLVFNVKPTASTSYSSIGRPLDSGDFLPFDWENDHRSDFPNAGFNFFKRLAPNGSDFGIARYYQDAPTATSTNPATDPGEGYLQFTGASPQPEPLIAMGDTPISSAALDVRCWYEGKGGHQKCNRDPDFPFLDGWWEFAACNDPDFGCWRPFFIVISDGDDNCGAVQNPTAVTANLKSNTGVKVWTINVGNPKNCQGGSVLKTLAQNTDGECINVDTKQQLVDTIADIAGQIREEIRAFASAAVPSVQATADQAIYLSSFTPIQGASVWDGHMNAFLKPLPRTADGFPDTTHENFLW
ncbi:MAG: hypothetical protein R3234_02080, partial [Thermoanaerobaculia bacterium]|nr:hypothetical protein [Thermoanaerobaculia bacterium]